jgi:hypothetical protein
MPIDDNAALARPYLHKVLHIFLVGAHGSKVHVGRSEIKRSKLDVDVVLLLQLQLQRCHSLFITRKQKH